MKFGLFFLDLKQKHIIMRVKVTLVNSGQDFQSFVCDENGKIVEVNPESHFPSIWLGSYLPIKNSELLQEGEYCPIRKSYSASFGYLRHIIQKIEII